jgi:hypothetical protein
MIEFPEVIPGVSKASQGADRWLSEVEASGIRYRFRRYDRVS